MSTPTRSLPSTLRVVLTFPLIRIPLLGGLMFLGVGIANGLRSANEDAPLIGRALVRGVVAVCVAIYVAFVRFVEVSTAAKKSATGRCKTRPVAGLRAPWPARSPNSWSGSWRFGPQGQRAAAHQAVASAFRARL